MLKKLLFLFAITLTIGLLTACDVTTTTTNVTTSSSTTTTSTGTSTDSVTTIQRVFTLDELAQYNGDNGSTAYVAIYGVVYDVTHVSNWSNGWHQGMHLAGTDASWIFGSSPHTVTFISQYPIVGTLAS